MIKVNSAVRSAYGEGVVQGRTEFGYLVRYNADQVAGFISGNSIPVGRLFTTIREDTHTVLVEIPEKSLEVKDA